MRQLRRRGSLERDRNRAAELRPRRCGHASTCRRSPSSAVAAVLVGHRLRQSLGRQRLHRVHDESPCRPGRPVDPGDHRRHPHRRAGASGTTATALRPRLPPGPPLHDPQHHAHRAARDRAHHLLLGRWRSVGLPWLVLPKIGTVPRWGAIAAIFVAMDGLNWFAHLANHRSACSGASTNCTTRKRT